MEEIEVGNGGMGELEILGRERIREREGMGERKRLGVEGRRQRGMGGEKGKEGRIY